MSQQHTTIKCELNSFNIINLNCEFIKHIFFFLYYKFNTQYLFVRSISKSNSMYVEYDYYRDLLDDFPCTIHVQFSKQPLLVSRFVVVDIVVVVYQIIEIS